VPELAAQFVESGPDLARLHSRLPEAIHHMRFGQRCEGHRKAVVVRVSNVQQGAATLIPPRPAVEGLPGEPQVSAGLAEAQQPLHQARIKR
jgi:hypothetical protein